MRIRTQLVALVAASLAAGLLAAALVFVAARQSNAASEVQLRAQLATHEVAGLLALTQEYARHSEPRAAQQWNQRHSAIATTLNQDVHERLASVALLELRSVVSALPPLFSRLEDIADANDAFSVRRKEALLDQLLTSTQAMNDYAYQWFQDATLVKREAEHQFQIVAFAVPFAMLALLIATAVLVRKRVLLPMKRLDHAAAKVGSGDMSYRIDSTAKDEIGDLSRQFDAMTNALVQSGAHLQRSEKQLREITDNLPALIAYIGLDHRYEFANGKYRDWWALDPAAMVGRHVSDVLGPGAYGAIRGNLARALRGERLQWTGSSSRSGTEAHYLAEYIPDIAADGTVRGCYALTVDITQRREAEMSVARSEQRLLDLTNSIPAMVGYFNMEEHCEYANDTGLKSQGLERSDMPGLTLRSALGEVNYAQHEPYVKEVLQGRRARFQGIVPFQGRSAYFQAHLIPDRLDGGAQRGFYVMTFDVTAMKEAQNQQLKTEARLRAITDNLPVLISYIDQDERYRFVNQTLKNWLGIEPEAVIGRKVCEVIDPEFYEQRREYIHRALRGERVTFELQSNTQDVKRSLQNTYIPDIQSDGGVAGIYTLSTDVSALKTVELKLSQLVRVDTLTGLANRYQFNEVLPIALLRAARTGKGVALMFLDVDHFKSINDTHGHAAGDGVLREFAARLMRCVRATDTVARFAGDEFVVVLDGLNDESESQLVAEKIVAQTSLPFNLEGVTLDVTASVGVAYHAPVGGPVTAIDLLARADKALYSAKRAGRNTYRMAEELT